MTRVILEENYHIYICLYQKRNDNLIQMNYYKNTLTPIADAARFFREKKNTISYEEKNTHPVKRGELNGLRMPAASFPASPPKVKSGMLRMEHY